MGAPVSFFAPRRPRAIGHRGAAGLAPENTLVSLAVADALGVEYLEIDVHGTRDGRVVIIHDPTLERTTDGAGPVAQHSWAELQRLDAGFHFSFDGRHFPFRGQGVRIPSFEAVLGAFPDCCFNIEVKQEQPPLAASVIDIVRRMSAQGRVLLTAENHSIMEAIRTGAEGEIVTGMSAADVMGFMDRLMRQDWEGYAPPGRALQVPPAYDGMELVTAESVRAAHAVGLEVHVWTINDPAEIDRLLGLGVDGIVSDRPGLVRTAVAQFTAR